MSRSRPENISPSDDPDERVRVFIEEHGKAGELVLNAFNFADPLNVDYGYSSDEYLGYAKGFIRNLSGKQLAALSRDEITELVSHSFDESQISEGFVEKRSIDAVANFIVKGRDFIGEYKL
ncbi:hypothetical protein HY503_01430 [Candidatus Woesebacteria bacterium]|nr:hypothetical protein [Candidatus Woesebacteria bacterium]